MKSLLKATQPDCATENETLTLFEDWRNQLEFFLSQDKDLVEFLDPNCTWIKIALKVANYTILNVFLDLLPV